MRDRSIAICIAAFVCACGPTSHSNNGGDDDGTVDANTGGGGGGGGGGSNGSDAAQRLLEDRHLVRDRQLGIDGPEQTNLIANFPTFISVLDASGLDYRVAVTTTARNYTYTMTVPIIGAQIQSTMGESGAMLKKGTMTKRWIDKADQDVAGTFATLANVGITGSADEMPLGAVRGALGPCRTGERMGFRRSDALLGIVILTDENDCSYEASVTLPFGQSLCSSMMEPASNYKTFLDQYTGNPTRWAAAISGKGPGRCSSGFGDAAEATRLIDFKNQVGSNAIMSSICDGNLSMGLGQALMLFQNACGDIIF